LLEESHPQQNTLWMGLGYLPIIGQKQSSSSDVLGSSNSVPHIAHSPCNLRCPVAVWIMSNTSAADFSRTDIHKKQEMPPFKSVLGSHFNMGKVCCCRYILLRFNKLKPISTPSAFWVWNNGVSVKNVPDSRCTNIVAEVFYDTRNAVIAPRWIFICQPQYWFDASTDAN